MTRGKDRHMSYAADGPLEPPWVNEEECLCVDECGEWCETDDCECVYHREEPCEDDRD